MKHFAKLTLTLAVLMITANTLAALTWDDGQVGSVLWPDDANWSGDVEPTSVDDAWLNATNDYALIEDGIAAVCNQFILARHSGNTNIVLEITGGTLTTSNLVFIGQYSGSEGTLIMSGGTINCGSEFAVGTDGQGSMEMTGGTVNISTAFKVGRYNNATAIGHLDLHGGTINCDSFYINDYSTMDIANDGTLIIDGNETSNISAYIAAGKLTACGGTGTVDYDYDVTNAGMTTVSTSCTTATGPTDPTPANFSVDIDTDQDISWTPSTGVNFDVYLGLDQTAVTNATPASDEYLGTVSTASYDPGHLQRGHTYYWRIDELDSSMQLISTGTVWRFETDPFDATDLGPTTVTFDYTDVRSIPAEPAAGVHPRLYFGPSEITDIQWRLANTTSGQEAQAQITAYVTLMDLGYTNGTYDRSAPYARDSLDRERISNHGLYDCKEWYDNLVAGTANPLDGADTTKRILMAGMMAVRAFDSLMKNDTADLTNIGKAIANFAEAADNVTDYQCFVHLAYAYDMAYNEMTQTDIDRFLAEMVIYCNNYLNGSLGQKPYGMLEEAYSSTSNWTALNSFYTLAYLAVEGEHPSLDAELFEGTKRAMHNFLTYGFYDSGAGYEGLGKNYVWATALIAYNRQGADFVAHPHVRSYAEEYIPALMQPFGYAWSAYDSLGGSGFGPDPITQNYWKPNAHDMVGLKWIFPNSPEIDFQWRNYISDEYDYRQFVPRGYDNPLLVAAIFASDYDDDNSSWDSTIVPETFFAGDRGLMHTRSGTTKDATALHFHCRQDTGGHTNADRLHFNVSALERVWGCYRSEVTGGATGNPHEAKYQSIILIDDTGVMVNTKDGVKSRQPSEVIGFDDQTNITKMIGDATYAYTYEWDWDPQIVGQADSRLSSGWTAVTKSHNDFRYTPGTEAYHDIDFYNYACWYGYPLIERMAKRQSLPMDYIYRTAGLIRGDDPYVMIVDDVALTDGQSHNYKWQMQLVDDLTIDYTDTNFVDSDYRCDIVLKEPVAAGNRRLLVRVLQNDGYTTTPGYILTRPEPRYEVDDWPALVVEAVTSSLPNFKVLIWAFNDGDTLPTTAWNGSELTVTIGTQVDTFDFSVANGLTSYTFARAGADTTPPAAPTALTATPGDASVSLDWADNSEQDFDTYSIYRSTSSGSYAAALATGLTSSNYTDNTAANGTTYYYVVTAVDTSANESANSSEVSATPTVVTTPVRHEWDNGAADSLWSSADNWNQTTTIPAAIDDAWINNTGDYAIVQSGIDALANQFVLARHTGKTNISMDMTGGSITTTDLIFIGQYPGSEGTLTMSGGTINVGSEMGVGTDGTGTLTMTGGIVNVTTNLKVGRYNNVTAIGHLDLDAGTINCNDFSINDYSTTDIQAGTLIIDGDESAEMNTYVTNSRLTAYDGTGTVNIDYNVTNPGKTTVTATAAADTTPPAAPTALTATPADSSVPLDWADNAEGDLASYSVYRSNTSGSYGAPLATGILTSDYTDNTTVNGTTYYYVVTAVDNSSNESANSTETNATPNTVTSFELGNVAASGSGDGWMSNMVIIETDIYTNNSGSTQTIQIDEFEFYARQLADPVTPFVVKVNADNDFTVLAVGTTRTSSDYVVGVNTFDFFTGTTKSFILADGESIAPCFLDANADGSSSGSGSVIPYNTGTPTDEIWYTGGSAGTDSGSVTEGLAPTPGSSTLTTLLRNYAFNITFNTVGADTTPPAAPTSLAATPSDSSISLDWADNAEGDLASYSVYRSTISGSYGAALATGVSVSNYTDNTAANGTTYYYVVTATDTNANESSVSNEDSATPADSTAPAAPTGLAATAGDSSVSLNWNDNGEPDLASYSVYRSTTSGSYGAALATGVGSSNYTDNTAVNGTTYYYVVTAVDTNTNESANSSEDSATPVDSTAPAAPTGLAATAGDSTISLDWADNGEPDLASYSVYRSTTSGSYGAALATGVATSNYTDNTAVNGTTYYYVVTAVDTNTNESANSNEDSATPVDTTAPAAPTGLVASAGDSSVSLNWNDNGEGDLASYSVYRSTTSGSYTAALATGVGSSSYVDNTALNGVTYYYVVTAVDTNTNESAQSAEDSATPVDSSAPAAPTGLAATPSSNSVALDWADNTEPDLASYSVYRSTTSGSYGAALATGVATSDYTDNTAVNGTTYYYVVTAVDTNTNESAQSSEVSTTPGIPASECIWDDSAPDSLWSSATNWTLDFVPRTIDYAWINTTNDYALIQAGIDATAIQLVVARHTGNTNITLEMTGGSITTSDLIFIGQYPGSEGTMLMSGGLVNVGSEMGVGTDGAGTLTMTAGTINVTTNLKVGRYNNTSAVGHLDLDGGIITCGDFSINDYSDADIQGGILIIDGDESAEMNTYVTNNSLTAYDGLGTVNIDYNVTNAGKTTVTATAPDSTPPAAPTGLAATAGDGSVSLDWNDNGEGDLDTYSVYRSTTSGSYGTALATGISASNYTDNTAANGTTYYYVVTAVDTSANESDDSNEDSATPADATAPAAPTGLAATAGDSSVSLDWNDNGEGDLDSYSVYRSTTSGSYGAALATGISVSSYTDNTAVNGTTYYYVVTAVDTNSNESADSNEDSATPQAPSTWTQIISDDFESGLGNWNIPGTESFLYTDGTYAYQGNNAINLQDNNSNSVCTTSNLALSSYTEIMVDFAYICISMDKDTEDFWLQISTDGGTNFTTVEEWNLNDEFVNGQFYTDSVTITGYTLTDQTQLRFRCDASGNKDDVYIDEVVVSAK